MQAAENCRRVAPGIENQSFQGESCYMAYGDAPGVLVFRGRSSERSRFGRCLGFTRERFPGPLFDVVGSSSWDAAR